MTTADRPTLAPFALDLERLARLNGRELMTCPDGFKAAFAAVQGTLNQSRCSGEVEEALDGLWQWLGAAMTATADVALDRTPADRDDAEALAWLEIERRGGYGESLAEMAALVSARVAMVERVAQ